MLKSRLSLCFQQKGFLLSMTIMLALSLYAFCKNAYSFHGCDISMIQGASNLLPTNARCEFVGYWQMLFPVIVVLPFSFSYLIDKSQGNCPLYLCRKGKKAYYLCGYITSFIGGFIIIFIPLALNLLLNSVFFPHTLFDDTGMGTYSSVHIIEYWKNYLFAEIYPNSPIFHAFIFTLIPSFVAGVASGFVYTLSFFKVFGKFQILLILPLYIFHCFSSNAESFYFRYITHLSLIREKSAVPFVALAIMIIASVVLLIIQIRKDEL